MKYTREEKCQVLDVANSFDKWMNEEIKEKINDVMFLLLRTLTGRYLKRKTWRDNIRRWRAELEPIPFVPMPTDDVMKALSSMY